MQLVTTSYDPNTGWKQRLRADLDSPSTLVLAFGATEVVDRPAPLDELRRLYPRSLSSAARPRARSTARRSRRLGVRRRGALRPDAPLLRAAPPWTDAGGSRAAGESIARALLAPDLRAVLVLSDGLHVNGTALVEGLNAVLPSEVVVTGGLAGDGDRFKRTWAIDHGGWRAPTSSPRWASTATTCAWATAPKGAGTSSAPSAS
jgi:hypothetical protein